MALRCMWRVDDGSSREPFLARGFLTTQVLHAGLSMKAAVPLLLCGLCFVPSSAARAVTPAAAATTVRAPDRPALAPGLDRHDLSYAIGYRIGSQLSDDRPKVDMPTLLRGIKAAYARQPPTVSMSVMQHQLHVLAQQMHRQAMQSFHRMAEHNAEASAAFMRNN